MIESETLFSTNINTQFEVTSLSVAVSNGQGKIHSTSERPEGHYKDKQV